MSGKQLHSNFCSESSEQTWCYQRWECQLIGDGGIWALSCRVHINNLYAYIAMARIH